MLLRQIRTDPATTFNTPMAFGDAVFANIQVGRMCLGIVRAVSVVASEPITVDLQFYGSGVFDEFGDIDQTTYCGTVSFATSDITLGPGFWQSTKAGLALPIFDLQDNGLHVNLQNTSRWYPKQGPLSVDVWLEFIERSQLP